ncbi:MAG: radical SAM protein [Thermodesulfobacteriota bacterium]
MTLRATTIDFKPGERNVFFHILTACNLACRHCYINREQHGTATLSLATINRWLRLFFAPGKENNLIFLGGEPTLHEDLAEAVHEARRIGYRSVTIDSNGYLFHDILHRIRPEEAVLSFSLDGPTPEVNDPIRGEGVFTVCTANIRAAVALGFSTSVIYTVSSRNIDHLHAMPQLLRQLGVKRFFIQVIGLRGKSAATGTELQLSHDQWLRVVPEAARRAAELGLTVIYPKVFLDRNEPFHCAGNVAENYFIFPNGRVYQCPLCEDYPINAYVIDGEQLVAAGGINERQLFSLSIPEGCVMHRLLQHDNIPYDDAGIPLYRISCCLLKNRIAPE